MRECSTAWFKNKGISYRPILLYEIKKATKEGGLELPGFVIVFISITLLITGILLKIKALTAIGILKIDAEC